MVLQRPAGSKGRQSLTALSKRYCCVHTYSGVQQSRQRHQSVVHCSLVVLAMAEVPEVWLREGTGGGGNDGILL